MKKKWKKFDPIFRKTSTFSIGHLANENEQFSSIHWRVVRNFFLERFGCAEGELKLESLVVEIHVGRIGGAGIVEIVKARVFHS